MDQAEELADLRLRYEAVMGSIDPSERAQIESHRETHEAGRRAPYAHDMQGAINQGYRNRARDAIAVAMAEFALASSYGSEPIKDRKVVIELSGLMNILISVAAKEGVSAEDIRWALQRALDREDWASIERLVEKAHGKGDGAIMRPPRGVSRH